METNDFGYDKSQAENTKISIDRILGKDTTSKRVKKNEADKKKIIFVKMIDTLLYVDTREIILLEDHNIDLGKYNTLYHDVIDGAFSLLFTKEQMNIINFFLYDRYTPDGGLLSLTDTTGNPVPFETPEDLWAVIKNMK